MGLKKMNKFITAQYYAHKHLTYYNIMRNFVFLLIIFCTPIIGLSQNHTKVISYNIWNGYDWGKDEARRGQTNEWIGAQKPSIVALQELCKYTPEKLAEDAKSWGHDHSVLLKTSGYSVGLTSEFPIEIKERIMDGMHHGALHCKTGGIDVFVIHFSPSSYQKRREEIAIIIEKLKVVRETNGNYIVLGDFNSQSPIDADLYDPNGALLSRLRESNKDKPLEGNLFNNQLDYAGMSALLAFPLMDVCQSFTKGMEERGSFPAQALGNVNNESHQELLNRMERIDYIMASPDLAVKCVSAKVHNGKPTYFLSDHYPVVAEFDLSK